MTLATLTPRAAREQATFRALLNAMSRPGTTGNLTPLDQGGRFAAALSVLEALVDHEVSFAVVPERPEIAEIVLRQTGSHLAAPAVADYVLCDADSLVQSIDAAKTGDLEYPDRGATIVCLGESVTEGASLRLSGPGIRDTSTVSVAGFTPEAVAAFRRVNAGVPLGIDLVLVAPDGRFVCLSRYTRVEGEG